MHLWGWVSPSEPLGQIVCSGVCCTLGLCGPCVCVGGCLFLLSTWHSSSVQDELGQPCVLGFRGNFPGKFGPASSTRLRLVSAGLWPSLFSVGPGPVCDTCLFPVQRAYSCLVSQWTRAGPGHRVPSLPSLEVFCFLQKEDWSAKWVASYRLPGKASGLPGVRFTVHTYFFLLLWPPSIFLTLPEVKQWGCPFLLGEGFIAPCCKVSDHLVAWSRLFLVAPKLDFMNCGSVSLEWELWEHCSPAAFWPPRESRTESFYSR